LEPLADKPRRSWPEAHWKLLLGLGLVLSLVLVASFVGGVFFLIRNSDAAKLAIATAESNPMLIERVGQPIKTGWLVTGSVHVSTESGDADLAIPISGPKGAGTIYVEASKRAGLWQLELLQYGNDKSDERLDLLRPDAKPASSQ
jgi:hypothetical protein